MKESKVSNAEIILRGYIFVNIPAIILIFLIKYLLMTYFKIDSKISIILAGISGWFYWEIAIKRWVKWALDKNVSPDELLKIGKYSLLIWSQSTIDKVKNK